MEIEVHIQWNCNNPPQSQFLSLWRISGFGGLYEGADWRGFTIHLQGGEIRCTSPPHISCTRWFVNSLTDIKFLLIFPYFFKKVKFEGYTYIHKYKGRVNTNEYTIKCNGNLSI